VKLESTEHWENTKNVITEGGGVDSPRRRQGDIEGKREKKSER
jgi:hypothetical protein